MLKAGLYTQNLCLRRLAFILTHILILAALANEIFRACRLVIDTGIHHKKWTREQALAYFIQNCPSPENDLRKEVERYIVWPAQATGIQDWYA
jgi:uncharacterized protein (DUF885 family)